MVVKGNSFIEDQDPVWSARPLRRSVIVRCSAVVAIVSLVVAFVLVRRPVPLGRWEYILLGSQGKDEIHFYGHALIGATLNRIGLAPDLAGRQWLAAAAHTRTPAQVDAATNGLIRAKSHSGSASNFAAAVCAEGYGRRQIPAMQRAGLDCPRQSRLTALREG